METDLLPNVRGNVQTLRNIWATRVQEEQKLLKSKPVVCRSQSQSLVPPPAKQSIKIEIQSSSSVDETIIDKKPMVTFDNAEPMNFYSAEPSLEDIDDFTPLPPPPASIVFKEQAQSISTMQQTMAKMFDRETKKATLSDGKTNGIRHWHIARHVFRSGLIFGPTRRASDSIIPLLMKTHKAQHRSRTNSLDSNFAETPFQTLIDYIKQNDEHLTVSKEKSLIKRTISDASACIQRNKLDETVTQYEAIMRHLKNYEQFMTAHPKPSPGRNLMNTQENEVNPLVQKSSIRNRQTQSLARSAGRTFTEFVMNDLLTSQTNKPRRSSTIHAASQTDLEELIAKVDSIPMEDTKAAMEELDEAINHIVQEAPITPNSEVNVIIVNPSATAPEVVAREKPLMQRLFERKKSAYSPSELQMKSNRIPEELANTLEIAKGKCFFPTEQIIVSINQSEIEKRFIYSKYTTKMIKIDRRGYKQHVRLLCLTSERLYIITKKNPYPKEALLFNDILGISCTPCKDGFICLHTREMRDDRGDWIFVVDHPCEFITQLFMAMGKNGNNDQFLKIKNNFKHTRRNIATMTDECMIEARPSDTFHIAYENYDVLVIYTP